jgi:hypothetical protein
VPVRHGGSEGLKRAPGGLAWDRQSGESGVAPAIHTPMGNGESVRGRRCVILVRFDPVVMMLVESTDPPQRFD